MPDTSPNGRYAGNLIEPTTMERSEVLRRWRRTKSGMDGERGDLPEKPDDAVAYQLLEAAETAMRRGDLQRGINILRLDVKDFRQSQEATFARRVIDRLSEQAEAHRR